ncbi:hypothetical protein FQN57_003542 [Myotisia sp. PD_48]|nr:hypothetical protein FQN57_003542 [Myotisia sp. PD_48]
MAVNLDNIIFHNPPGLSLPNAHSLPKPFKNPSSFVPASAPASLLPPVAPMLPNQPSGLSQKLPTLPLSLRSPTPLSLPPKPPPVLPLPKKPPTVLPFTQYLYQHPSPLGSQSPKCFHGSELEVPETQRNIFCIDWPAVETRDLTMNEFPKQKECEDPHLLPASNNIPSYIADEVISPGYSILDCRAAVCNIDPAILETQSPKGPNFTALPESNITMPNSLPAILDRAKCDDTEDLSISINSGVKGDKNQRVNSYDTWASVEPISIRESPASFSHELNSQDIASSPCEKGGGSSNKERAKKGNARGILKRARAVAVEIPIPHNHLSSVSDRYPGVHNKSSREVVKGDDNHISSDDDQEDSDYNNSENDSDMQVKPARR